MCCSKKQTQPADGFDQVNFKTITHIHCFNKNGSCCSHKKAKLPVFGRTSCLFACPFRAGLPQEDYQGGEGKLSGCHRAGLRAAGGTLPAPCPALYMALNWKDHVIGAAAGCRLMQSPPWVVPGFELTVKHLFSPCSKWGTYLINIYRAGLE